MPMHLTGRLGIIPLAVIASALVCRPLVGQQAARKKSGRAVRASAPALNMEAVGEARRALDDKLLDYPAARFRDVRLVKTDKGFTAFCGQINTTNRMGGYGGWRGFVLPLGDTGVGGLYDKPTIDGQPTTMGSLFNRYGAKPIEGDPATRLVAGACGSTAVRADQADYTAALTFQR